MKDLELAAKQVGNRIIDMSLLLASRMDRWSYTTKNLKDTEVAGFINKEVDGASVDIVVDIEAPESTQEATLRTWAIESISDENGNERFNNIQLYFSVSYEIGSKLAKDYKNINHEKIRSLLHSQDTKLKRIIISNQTGRDKHSQKLLGERYDISEIDQLGQDQITTITTTLEMVLSVLEKSAASEA